MFSEGNIFQIEILLFFSRFFHHFLGSLMFSEGNIFQFVILAIFQRFFVIFWAARRATMCIFLSENITDSRKDEWHMQEFE